MSWLSKIRNTTGTNVGGNAAGPTFNQTAVRPHTGAFQAHAALPPAQRLNARVDNVDTSGVTLNHAKEYVAQCERTFVQHPGPLNARTDGRARHFFKSAASAVGTGLGIGRGRAPHQEGEWTRSDIAQPVKLKTGQANLVRKVFETPAKREARREAQASITGKVTELMGDSKIALRHATDREAALTANAAHVDGVRDTLLQGIQQARTEHVQRLGPPPADAPHPELLHDLASCRMRYETAVEDLRVAGQRLNLAEQGVTQWKQRERETGAEKSSIHQQRQALQALLATLPPAPAAGAMDAATQAQARAPGLLQRAQVIQQRNQATLVQRQQELDQAKHRLHRALPFSDARAMAKADVDACRTARNDARAALQRSQGVVDRGLANVKARNEAVQGLGQRVEVDRQLADLDRRLAALVRQEGRREANREGPTREGQLSHAKAAHEQAKEAEVKARIEMENADRAQAASRERREALEAQLPRLSAGQHSRAAALLEAKAHADTLRLQDQHRLTQKIETLINQPAGFDPAQVTPQLKAKLRELSARLNEVPADLMGTDQAEALRKFRLPLDDTLEITSRAVASATNGNPANAIAVLDSLMNRQFADLVPQRDRDFNGQPVVIGGPGDQSETKRAASILASRPSGGEMLQRLTQPPATTPSRQLQDAVLVYFRATTALSDAPPADAQSLTWLISAERAAKFVAHPPAAPAPPPGTAADVAAAAADPMNRLPGFDRQAFNGLRNNLLSVADGSPYDKINKSLKDFTDQWIPRGTQARGKASPLHARQLATKVAADVGLPTVENGLHSQLKTACNELLKMTQNGLVDARARANAAREQARAAPDGAPPVPIPEVPRALLEAKHLLQYVQKRADRGERIDTLRLGSSAWRSINKKVQADLELEQKMAGTHTPGMAAKLGAQIKGAVARTGPQLGDVVTHVRDTALPNVPRGVHAPQGPPADVTDLAVGMMELELQKPTVLQALTRLRDDFRSLHGDGPDAGSLHGSRVGGDDDDDAGGRTDGTTTGHDDGRENVVDAMLANTDWTHVPDPAALAENTIEVEEHRARDERAGGPSSGNPAGVRASGNRTQEEDDEITFATPRQSATLQRNPLLQPTGTPAESVHGGTEATGVEHNRPLTALDHALESAEALKGLVDRFADKKGDFSAAALEQWMIPSITNTFGAVAVNQGKQFGIGTGGVIGVVSQIGGALGLVIRPDVEFQGSVKDQFRYGRDALGIELSVGRTHGGSGSVGVTAGMSFDVNGTNKHLGAGPGVSLNHTFAGSNRKDGAVIRAPKFDGRTHPELTRDFSEMVSSLLTWHQPTARNGDPLYHEPLQALLDKHPTVSLSTVESATVRSHTSNLNVVGFASPGGAVGDGPTTASAGANFFAGINSSKSQEKSRYKTLAGTQGMLVTEKKSTYTLSGMGGLNQVFNAGNNPDSKVRARLALAAASVDLRRSSAQSGVDMVNMPDGSLAADRFVEYNNYEKFEKAVKPHWEKWIDHGINSATWPEGFPDTDKRIMVERTLNDFMAKAKQSIKAGTVTLHENMDVKPEVGAQLTANVALEELARMEGRHEDAMALQVARQKILAEDSSYQPFLLKAIVKSSINQGKGLNLGISAMTTKGANASQVYDWFPRLGT
jgi:hypothetical protein